MNIDKVDKIIEWRRKHPRCSCCKYARPIPMDDTVRCVAKGRYIWFVSKPRRCELFEPAVGDV